MWMARALRVEEAQVVLSLDAQKIDARATETQRLNLSRRHDRLQSQINNLVQTMATFLGLDWDSRLDGIHRADTDGDEDDTFITLAPGSAEHAPLPLPSYIGVPWCHELGLIDLVEQELQLRQGQANDTLHEIRLGLADKAVLFRTEVRHGRNYVGTTHA